MNAVAHGGQSTLSGAAPPLVLVVLFVAGYLLAAWRVPHPVGVWRVAAWVLGWAAVTVAVLLPGHGDPRTHALQHLLLGMLAPTGLVLAAPATLLLRTASPPVRRAAGRVLRSRTLRLLGHTATATLLSTGGLYLVMLTPVYAAAERQTALHQAVHLHYLMAGYVFAWAVIGADPAPRTGLRTRVAALLTAASAHAFLAKYLYAHAGTLPPGAAFHDLHAARAAAELMYYGGDLAEMLLALALFGVWYRQRGHRRPAGRAPRGCRRRPPGQSRADRDRRRI